MKTIGLRELTINRIINSENDLLDSIILNFELDENINVKNFLTENLENLGTDYDSKINEVTETIKENLNNNINYLD